MTTKRITKSESRRLAILVEAERLNVPALATPTWRATYGKGGAK